MQKQLGQHFLKQTSRRRTKCTGLTTTACQSEAFWAWTLINLLSNSVCAALITVRSVEAYSTGSNECSERAKPTVSEQRPWSPCSHFRTFRTKTVEQCRRHVRLQVGHILFSKNVTCKQLEKLELREANANLPWYRWKGGTRPCDSPVHDHIAVCVPRRRVDATPTL